MRERLNFVKEYPDGSSPWSSACDLSSSRGFVLSRSRSCRASVNKNSPWFQEEDDGTPPCSSHIDFPGRTVRFQRRCVALNYGNEIGTPSREESQNFEKGTCDSVFEGESVTTASKGGITNIHDFVAGLKMARVQYQKQLNDQVGITLLQGNFPNSLNWFACFSPLHAFF